MSRIIIIDTGVNLNHSLLNSYNIKGFGASLNSRRELMVNENFDDQVGHGTGIAYVLCRYIEDLELIVVKAFDSKDNIEEELLIKILEYIDVHWCNVDIVSMSLGITICEHKDRLQAVCNSLYNKGIVLVAAYDNEGKMTYPACFKNVIGVDCDTHIKKVFDYIYVKNSPVNIRANSLKHRLPGLRDSMVNVYGTSFAVPYVDVIIANIINKYGKKDLYEILEEQSKELLIYDQLNDEVQKIEKGTAIIFPYQKETKNIVRYADRLEIYGICDVRTSKQIGRTVNSVVKEKEYVITDIDKIDWNDNFNMVILGYCRSRNISPEILKGILDKCKKYKKTVYTFSSEYSNVADKKDISEIVSITPKLNKYKDIKFGKMWEISLPVLCVVGTSSIQGKFSTQILVREALKRRGYQVGHLGTEPYAALVNCDECFPYGYDSQVYMSPADKILCVNDLMHRIENKNPDIILSGLQSNLWHHNWGNIMFCPTDQYETLIGINPDAVIICVNYDDEMEYIQKSILYVEQVWEIKCIAIVLFPYKKNMTMENVTDFEFSRISEDDIDRKKGELKDVFEYPIMSLDEEFLADNLVDIISDFFS